MTSISKEIRVKNRGYKLKLYQGMPHLDHNWTEDNPHEVPGKGGLLEFTYKDLEMVQRSPLFSLKMKKMIDDYIKTHFILDHNQGCFINFLELIKVFGIHWRDLIVHLISFYGLQRRMNSFWFYRYGNVPKPDHNLSNEPMFSKLRFVNSYYIYYVEPLYHKRGVHIQQTFIWQIADLKKTEMV